MKLRDLGIALTALSALTPAISRADTVALQACVAAFEKTLDAPSGASRAFRLVHGDDEGLAVGSIARFYRLTSVYDLSANDSKTGAVIARARCAADSRGVISQLLPLPEAPEQRDAQRAPRMARD